MRLRFLIPAMLLALCSCAGRGGSDTASGSAEKFMRYCLNMERDSAAMMCDAAVMDSLSSFFDSGAPADSNVDAAFRRMLSSSEVTAVSEEHIGKDTVLVTLGVNGAGRKYEGRLLMVSRDGGWFVSEMSAE